MTQSGYTNRPTLLYIYQGLIRRHRMGGKIGESFPPFQPAEAAEKLTTAIKAGNYDVKPDLPPDWRLLPQPGDQLLVVEGANPDGQSAIGYYCQSITTLPTMFYSQPWSRPKPAKPAQPKPKRPARDKPAGSDNIKKVAEALKNRSLKKVETILWETFRNEIPGLTHREFRAGAKLARKRSAKPRKRSPKR